MTRIEDVTNFADAARVHGKTRGDSLVFDFEDRLTTFAQFDAHTQPRSPTASPRWASGPASASPISARTATSTSNS